MVFLNAAASRYCRTFSVLLNFKDPRCFIAGVYCRFVMVKLRVKGTRAWVVAVVLGKECVPEVPWFAAVVPGVLLISAEL